MLFLPALAQNTPAESSPEARTLRIVEADRLELRNEGDEEIIILTGSPVRMVRGDDRIEAERVIYNRTRKKLYLLGAVRLTDKENRVVEAQQLDLDASDDSFEAMSVKIQSGQFDLTGPLCQRAAGQILLSEGYLTPCARCGQAVDDYGFRAKEVLLYPGDRIIAREVWVLLKGQPVLYLPVLLLHLSERRPRLELGQDDTLGWWAQADLPYVSDFGIGFTLLRYYENRGWGLGFDHWGTDVAREHYRFLLLPPNPNLPGVPQLQYSVEYKLEEPDWRYEANLKRDDAGSDPLPGRFENLGGRPLLTDVDVNISKRQGEPALRFSLRGVIDHDPLTPRPGDVQRLPEVEVGFPQGYRAGGFSLTARMVVGIYGAPPNPANRSARQAFGSYGYAGRVLLEHAESYNTQLWSGASFSFSNRFLGYYYSTRNPSGEYERQIDWTTSASFRQVLGPFSLSLSLNRSAREGENPFSGVDPSPSQRATRQTRLGIGLSYTQGLFSLSASTARVLENSLNPGVLNTNPYDPLTLTLGYSSSPLSVTLTHTRDLNKGKNLTTSGSIQYTPQPFNFGLNTSYNWDWQERGVQRWGPLNLSAGYALPGGNISLSHTRDLNTGWGQSTTFSLSLRVGLDSYTLSQTVTDANPTQNTPATLSGSARAIWGVHSLSFSNAFRFQIPNPAITDPNEDTANLTLAYSNSFSNTNLSLSGVWYFREGYVKNPLLSFSQILRDPGRTLTLRGVWHFPERDQPYHYLQTLSFIGGLEVFPAPLLPEDPPGLAIQGGLNLNRTPDSGKFALVVSDFGPTFSFVGAERTRLFLSAFFSGNASAFPGDSLLGILKPRIVVVLDRCCWALRFTLDAQKNAATLSFLYGGQAADFFLDQNGFQFPGLGDRRNP